MYDVSIVIPTYLANDLLERAIKSALSSKTLNTQIVVIEDGSPKPSLAFLQSKFAGFFSDQGPVKIDYLEQKNQGAYLARLNALQYCRGQFIKFLDQDDYLLEGALASEVSAFNQDVDVVISDWLVEEKSYSLNSQPKLELMKAPVYHQPIDDFLTIGGVFTSAALYRTDFIQKVLKPVNSFVPIKADDWLIFAQVCLAGARYHTLEKASYVWTKHDNQLSAQSRQLLIKEHYHILYWVESELVLTKRMTAKRKMLLANYYAKQLIEAHRLDKKLFTKLVERIERLAPRYRQQHGNQLCKLLCNTFGLSSGVLIYSAIKSLIKH